MKRELLLALKETGKRNTLQITKRWVVDSMQNFKDPVRAGTLKGDPIGFSRAKMEAAHFVVLHPSFRLAEIAQFCNTTSPNLPPPDVTVLNFWRTQDDFREKVREVSPGLSVFLIPITKTILADQVDENFPFQTDPPKTHTEWMLWLVGGLASLSDEIVMPVWEWGRRHIKENPEKGAETAIFLEEVAEVKAVSKGVKALQKVKTTFIKGLIGMALNLQKGAGRERMLKFIGDQLDELIEV